MFAMTLPDLLTLIGIVVVLGVAALAFGGGGGGCVKPPYDPAKHGPRPKPPGGSAVCRVPPPGWRCTREAGHEGPCAAVPAQEER